MENDVSKKPTSKQRVSRIPLNYHQRSDGIRRSRNRLTVVAALLAIAVVAAIALSRELHNAGVSPGPVARVHMASEQNCSACHENFTAIHEDARLTNATIRHARIFSVADSAASIEKKCQYCHHSAPHHPHQIDLSAGSCTACHHEHRGEEAALTDADERSCTRCHAQIENHIKPQFLAAVPDDAKSIMSFPFNHPEFRSQESDPTRLKFNHQLHLSPGVRNEDERRPAWTLADVAPDLRAKYRRPRTAASARDQSDETTVVELGCRDCHLSIADKSAGLGAGADASLVNFKNMPRNQKPLETGAYMLPVKFAEHCQGCHPLAIERSGAASAHDNEVPHGVEGLALRQLLAGRFWERQSDERSQEMTTGQKSSQSRIRPLPGESPSRLPRDVETTVERRVRQAETHLRDVACKKCHESGAAAQPNGPISIEPVNMPVVWLQKSHFNHRAHRSVFDKSLFDQSTEEGCLECHDAKSSTKTSDVLIKGIAKCRECHSPEAVLHQFTSGEAGSRQKTGADFRCIECHRYHRADLEASVPAAVHGHDRVQQPEKPLQEGNRASEE